MRTLTLRLAPGDSTFVATYGYAATMGAECCQHVFRDGLAVSGPSAPRHSVKQQGDGQGGE